MDGNRDPYSTSRWQALLARCRALGAWCTRRRVLAGGTAAVVALVALLMVGVTTSPEQRSAATGADLFDEIMAQYPDLRASSQIAAGADRGAAANELMLPTEVWEQLPVEQRNSLGSWLNELGGDWVIRVGAVAEDGKRIRGAQAVITSREWNRQLR